jgi:hypothetical protein
MLADSVEAVVRSVKNHSAESIAALVEKIIHERIAEGEMHDSELTIRDLEEIKAAFTTILIGMYHPRIEYPAAATLIEPDVSGEVVALIDVGDGDLGPPEGPERLPSSAT